MFYYFFGKIVKSLGKSTPTYRLNMYNSGYKLIVGVLLVVEVMVVAINMVKEMAVGHNWNNMENSSMDYKHNHNRNHNHNNMDLDGNNQTEGSLV